MELEKRGTATVTVATDAFARLAALQARSMGYPGLAVVVVPHPLGGIDPQQVQAKVAAAADAVVELVQARS